MSAAPINEGKDFVNFYLQVHQDGSHELSFKNRLSLKSVLPILIKKKKSPKLISGYASSYTFFMSAELEREVLVTLAQQTRQLGKYREDAEGEA
jgi:hypothetical protein